jgi:hypothetical protein
MPRLSASAWARLNTVEHAAWTACSSICRISTAADGRALGAVAVDQVAVGVDRVADLVDRDRRGHLAGGVAAHAVGDQEQPQLLVDEEVVLVVGPLAPHVGGGREGQLHRRERRTGFPGRSNHPGG